MTPGTNIAMRQPHHAPAPKATNPVNSSGITICVTAAEVLGPDFPSTQIYRGFVGERDPWQADGRAWCVFVVRLLDVDQVGPGVSVCDDFGDREHLEIATGMVVVLVGVQHVFERLVGHRFHLSHDVGVVPIEHVVHEDDALAGHIQGDIPTFARNHVQVALHPVHAERARGLGALGVRHPCALEHKNRDQDGGERCAAHAADYSRRPQDPSSVVRCKASETQRFTRGGGAVGSHVEESSHAHPSEDGAHGVLV